jgi:hypothetical protein
MLRGIGRDACGGARCFVEESRGKGFSQTCPVRVSQIRAQMDADFLIGGMFIEEYVEVP